MHGTTGTAADREVVGRDAELDQIRAFLERRPELPGGLVIEGPAGAGKTTIWRAGIEAARAAGYLVLSCRPAGAEVQLAHAALSDLLEPHLDAVLAALPRPQRQALEVALLLVDGGGATPDQRAVAAGALNAIRALAGEQPVLLAIDDAQWVDAPSAAVLEFAMRRLGDAPVAILASRRLPSPAASAPGAAAGVRLERAMERPPTRVEVGPLSLGAMHRLLRLQMSAEFNRPTLQRIHATSGGNPFYALELVRAMAAGSSGSEPLALSTGLNDLLADRLTGLAAQARDALFVAAALTQPTLELVAAAVDNGADEGAGNPARNPAGALAELLSPAISAGIVRVANDAIEFAHPLLAAAAYNAVELDDRRRWHARIADVARDSEIRARHLALARPGLDPEVAELLHAAAREALARGAPGIAAELYAEAIDRLDPDAHARPMWILEAAPVMRLSGAVDRAKVLVHWAVERLDPGPDRSEALRHLADLIESEADSGARSLELVDQAIVEAGTDPRRRASALMVREMRERSTARLDLALPFARRALEAAEESGDLQLQASAHVRMADLEVLQGLGGEDPIDRFSRAEELDRQVHVDAEDSAPVMLAVCLIRAGRLDEARPRLLEGRRRARAEGDEMSWAQICLFLAELDWLGARWDDGAAFATEGLEVAEQAGSGSRIASTTAFVALFAAARGQVDRARVLAERAISLCDRIGEIGYGRYARQVLGFLELSLGDAAATVASLQTYVVGHAIEGPKRIAFIPDAIEALVQLGEVERAANLATEVARRGTQLRRRPMVAGSDRCLALIRAAQGDLDAGMAFGQRAVAEFTDLGQPFERARSLLVLGEVQRRAKQRRAARGTLTAAVDAFAELGAPLWTAKAEAERARIGGRTAIAGLTETELRVATLVASGKSNKEVAAELFVSVRAIESNLSKVYAKLGIESRTELARRL